MENKLEKHFHLCVINMFNLYGCSSLLSLTEVFAFAFRLNWIHGYGHASWMKNPSQSLESFIQYLC